MSRSSLFVSLVCAVLLAVPAGAQQAPNADVTFVVPLNLTRLVPELTRVRVNCGIESMVLAGNVRPGPPADPTGLSPGMRTIGTTEVAVVQGSVAQTVQVTVPVAQSDFVASAGAPSGRVAQYECAIVGYSASLQGWSRFVAGNPTGTGRSTFWLTPMPAIITGQFVW